MYKLTAPLMTLYFFVSAKIEDRKETGAVAIEYALLATLIAIAIILAVTGVGTRLITKFNNITF